jgi:hypothetical protein
MLSTTTGEFAGKQSFLDFLINSLQMTAFLISAIILMILFWLLNTHLLSQFPQKIIP